MKPSRIANTRLSNMAHAVASTGVLLLLHITVVCLLLPLINAKDHPDKVFDLFQGHRTKRYLGEARSWRYTRHAIDVLKADLNNNDLYFCRGDPFRGVQCPEEPFCAAWDQICDGEQICALEHRKECLERSEASFGRMDSRLCDGDENPKWCHWKYQAPVRCGEDIFLEPTRRKVRIHSPRFPENYPGDYFCFWTVSVPEGHNLTVNFKRFETEPNYDLLSLGTGYNRENSRSVIIFKHSGFKKPSPSAFDVASNIVWVTFKSDDWENFKGFSIEFVDGARQQFGVVGRNPFNQEPNRDCGGKILMKPDKETIVHSPRHPDFYPNNVECEWVVSIEEGLRIRIHFEAFDVEEEEDHLSVGNGISSRRAPILYKYSSRTKPADIISRGSDVWFKFVSSFAVARRGFKAVLTEQPINDCGGIFTVPSHGMMSFGSQDYPNNYPALSDCLWQFRSASDRRIHIGFKEFDTEYGYDIVRIGNGFEPNVNGSNVEITHSGSSLPGGGGPKDLTFQSAGPVAWLDFKADDFTQMKGFRFVVYSEESSPWVVDESISYEEPTLPPESDTEIFSVVDELPDLQQQDQEIEDPNAHGGQDATNGEKQGTNEAEPEPEPQPEEPRDPQELQPDEPDNTDVATDHDQNQDSSTHHGRPPKKGKKDKKSTTEAPTTEEPTTTVTTTTEAVMTTEEEDTASVVDPSFSYSSDYDSGFSTSSSI
ncbi:bone morphogenetic protein 1-like [Acanthaster planci]|uniref:Bone morphogenetic protein 1-like n=1 Tax=Acanthaster planci TaxID=133434 RepID=A0A8B7Y580_ACAPL|nr:bone morphogenetic protein 1-like [Acanthaster planci]